LPLDRLQRVDAGTPADVAGAIEDLESAATVLYAEPDARRAGGAVAPNDPYFGRLWSRQLSCPAPIAGPDSPDERSPAGGSTPGGRSTSRRACPRP